MIRFNRAIMGSVVLAAALAACGDSSGGGGTPDAPRADARTADAPTPDAPTPDAPAAMFDLTFNGTGYTPHNNQTLEVAVVDVATGAVVQKDSVTVASGAFSFTWPGILVEGKDYEVRWYADLNGNGFCNEPPADHSWVATINDVAANQTLDQTHNATFTGVCGVFGTRALTFTGTGFSPHNGQTLKVAVLADDSTVVARGTATIAAGAFAFAWPALLIDTKSYRVHLFADVNGNIQCDAPPTDHAWNVDLGQITADVTSSYAHNTTFENVCATFP